MTEPAFIPFARPDIGQAEIDAVTRALRSGWVTTGPETRAFEQELATFLTGAGASDTASAAADGLGQR